VSTTIDNGMHRPGDAPDHVPSDLCFDYDFAEGPEIYAFPPVSVEGFRDRTPVFYSTAYGGFWVLTAYGDIRDALQDHDLFLPEINIPRYSDHKFIPLHVNPPKHSDYRRIQAPIFAPQRIGMLEDRVRTIMRETLEEIATRDSFEMMRDFALEAPSAMFCAMLDLPHDHYPLFRQLADDLFYGAQKALVAEGPTAAREVRETALKGITDILVEIIDARRDHPGDDVVGALINARIDGEPLTAEELLNMTTFLFFAGTDSTANLVTFAIAFLAAHPDAKAAFLARMDDPAFVRNASEELIRLHGFHHLARRVARDVTFAGVAMREGDIVILPTGGANRDGAKFPDPHAHDFDRENARTHLTFGAGIHRCSGSHLATLQLRVALEEIHRIIPDYRLIEPVTYASGGAKAAPAALHLATR